MEEPVTILSLKAALEPLTRTIDDLVRRVDDAAQERVELRRIQAKHQSTLYGNGSPGMDEDIRNIKRGIDVLVKLAWMVVSVGGGYFVIRVIEAFVK